MPMFPKPRSLVKSIQIQSLLSKACTSRSPQGLQGHKARCPRGQHRCFGCRPRFFSSATNANLKVATEDLSSSADPQPQDSNSSAERQTSSEAQISDSDLALQDEKRPEASTSYAGGFADGHENTPDPNPGRDSSAESQTPSDCALQDGKSPEPSTSSVGSSAERHENTPDPHSDRDSSAESRRPSDSAVNEPESPPHAELDVPTEPEPDQPSAPQNLNATERLFQKMQQRSDTRKGYHPNVNVKLTNVPESVDVAALRELAERCGPVINVRIDESRRGAVRFESTQHAREFIKACNNNFQKSLDHPLEASAGSLLRVAPTVWLRVRGFPGPLSEQAVREAFEKYGHVDEVFLYHFPYNARGTNAPEVYIKFNTVQDAKAAKRAHDGDPICELYYVAPSWRKPNNTVIMREWWTHQEGSIKQFLCDHNLMPHIKDIQKVPWKSEPRKANWWILFSTLENAISFRTRFKNMVLKGRFRLKLDYADRSFSDESQLQDEVRRRLARRFDDRHIVDAAEKAEAAQPDWNGTTDDSLGSTSGTTDSGKEQGTDPGFLSRHLSSRGSDKQSDAS